MEKYHENNLRVRNVCLFLHPQLHHYQLGALMITMYEALWGWAVILAYPIGVLVGIGATI